MTRYLPPIPDDLLEERVLPISTCAQLCSMQPDKFIGMAKAGRVGPLLKLGKRWYGVRLRDLRKFLREREVETGAA